MDLFDAAADKPARRIHRAINLLPAMRRLLKRIELSHRRATTDTERRWCLGAADALQLWIDAGKDLPGNVDPRPDRKARKRR